MDFFKKLFGFGNSAPEEDERDSIGWVVMSNTFPDLTIDSLRAALDVIYPGQFLPANDRTFVIDGATEGIFMIQSNVAGAAGMFMLHDVPGPYTLFSNFAEFIADPELRALATSQQAWISVDNVHVHTTEAEAYRFIGAVLAKLAPPDAAVLVHPSMPIAVRFDDDIRHRLAKGLEPQPDMWIDP